MGAEIRCKFGKCVVGREGEVYDADVPGAGSVRRYFCLLALLLVVAPSARPQASSSMRISPSSFVPASPTVWWTMLVNDNLSPEAAPYRAIRTKDGGRTWQDVTPHAVTDAASGTILGSFFLDRDTAWIWTIPGFGKPVGIAYRTTNGGRAWVSIGRLPSDNCDLHFVDRVHGWCADIGAAAGLEGVQLYRTVDGGATWTLVSVTSLTDESSTTESIPGGCDKLITFTSPTVGWDSVVCNGAPSDSLYSTKDGGRTWQARDVPFPTCGAADDPQKRFDDLELGAPVVKGSWAGLRILVECFDYDSGTRIITPIGISYGISTSTDGGTTWRTQSVPIKASSAALLDSTHWRLTDGTAR